MAIVSVPDKSGNARNLFSPTTNLAAQPDLIANQVNGLPVIRVADGDGMEIALGAFSPVWTGTGLSIYKLLDYTITQTGPGTCFNTFEANFGAHQIVLFLDVDVDLFGAGDPPVASVGWESTLDGFAFKYGLAAAVSGLQVLAWVFDSAAGTGLVYRNGVELALSKDEGIYTQDLSLGEDFLEFFMGNGGNQTGVGDYVTSVAYGAAHTPAQVLQVSTILMERGGLA